MWNAFVNLALPLFVFGEPSQAIVNVDVALDPSLQCPVKAVPKSNQQIIETGQNG